MCSAKKIQDVLSEAHLLYASGLGAPLSTRSSQNIRGKVQSQRGLSVFSCQLPLGLHGPGWQKNSGQDLGVWGRVAGWVSLSADSGNEMKIHETLRPPHWPLIYSYSTNSITLKKIAYFKMFLQLFWNIQIYFSSPWIPVVFLLGEFNPALSYLIHWIVSPEQDCASPLSFF